jgi:hypothetical protein
VVTESDEATDLCIEHRTLDHEAIARLAYFYWEERGCPNHSPDEDWLRAETELRNRLAAAASKIVGVRNVTKHSARIHHQPNTPF